MADNKKMLEALDRAIEDVKRHKAANQDSSALIAAIQKDLVEAIKPVLAAMVKDITTALKDVKIEVPKFDIPPITVEMPAINVPEVRVPRIDVPAPQVSVTVPEVKVPNVIMPDYHETTLRGVNAKNPVPVMMMGTDGLPLLFPGGGAGQGGGKANFLTIKDILTSLGNSVMDNTNNAINVNIVANSGGLTVTQASGVATSVNTIQLGGNNIATDSGVTGVGVQRIVHVTDVATSVNVTGFTASVAVSLQTDAGVTVMDETNKAVKVNVVAGSSAATQYNDGATPDVSGGNGTIAMLFDGGSTQSWSGSSYGIGQVQLTDFDGSVVSMQVRQVSGAIDSVEIASLPFTLDVKQVSGSTDSVNVVGFTSSVAVVGDTVSGAADSGEGPLKTGGIARTANPTAVSNGARVASTYDKLGRQVMRPVQLRDLIQTAYVALSTGTETTLLASASGVFSDLIYIMGANDSGAAVQVDIRAATAANKVMTLEIPANGTAGVSLQVPLPQDVAADTWTVDMPDITGTNVFISALFTKEV